MGAVYTGELCYYQTMKSECTFEACVKDVAAHGLCSGHLMQHKKGQELKPLRRRLDATLRDNEGRKFCPDCDAWKIVDDFYASSTRKDGRNGSCADCCTKRSKARFIPKPRPWRDPVCAYEPCDKPSINGPLCTGHTQQKRQGKELSPLRRKLNSMVRNELGQKMCASCDKWLNVDSFNPHARKNSDGLAAICRSCDSIAGALRKYNITRTKYDELIEQCGGECNICGGQSTNGDRLSIDHDHKCCPERGRSCGKCIRGLLCMDCNRAIGMMRDSPILLRSAAHYLEGR